MLLPFTTTNHIARGLSYWRVTLASGKTLTEGQLSFDLLRGTRNVDWALDLVGSGDIRNVRELTLCYPQGEATLDIFEPYTAFQMKGGTQLFFGSGEKVEQFQLIGRVDNKETGDCTCAIWDVLEQRLYVDHHTSVRDFAPWRENVAPLKAISFEVTGIRLNGGVP